MSWMYFRNRYCNMLIRAVKDTAVSFPVWFVLFDLIFSTTVFVEIR
jgi:hypothetical protein